MTSLSLWIFAARPKTLCIGAFPILLSASYAFCEGSFNPFYLFVSLLGAFSIQIGTNYSNDYFDFLKGADTSLRKGSAKILQQGLASPNQMKIAFIFFFSLGAFIGLYLGFLKGLIYLGIGVVCIVFSLLYSCGPFPLAYRGVADIFVLLFYGPVAFMTSYSLHGSGYKSSIYMISFLPGLIGLGPLILNNLRDKIEDAACKKRTLIVRYGEKFGAIYYLIVHLIAFILVLLFALKKQKLSLTFPLFCFLPYIFICKKLLSKAPCYQALFIFNAKILPPLVFILCFALCLAR